MKKKSFKDFPDKDFSEHLWLALNTSASAEVNGIYAKIYNFYKKEFYK